VAGKLDESVALDDLSLVLPELIATPSTTVHIPIHSLSLL